MGYKDYGEPLYERRRSRSRDRHRESRRDYRSRSRDRYRKRSRSRDRYREYRDRDRDYKRSRSRDRYRERRRSRSRGPPRDRFRPRERFGGREPVAKRPLSPPPPGTIPLDQRPRKLKQWDVAPDGFETISAMEAKMTGKFPLPYHLLTGSGMPGSSTTITAFQETVRPAICQSIVMRHQKRVYVSGVGPETNAEDLKTFLNETYREKGFKVYSPTEPIVGIELNSEKHYAFLECSCVEEANLVVELGQVTYKDHLLCIRKPNNYLIESHEAPSIERTLEELHTGSTNRIFIGSLPLYLGEDQVKELLTSFGELKYFNLIYDPTTGASKGYAFCEYVDLGITDIACQGLNGMEIGDKALVVQRASSATKLLTAPQLSLSSQAGSGILPQDILAAAGPEKPSKVLVLLNMMAPDDYIEDQEYMEIKQDIREECELYGPVEELALPRISDDKEIPIFPKVYVKFEKVEDAIECHKDIAGRIFNDRVVITAFFDESRYLRGDLMPKPVSKEVVLY